MDQETRFRRLMATFLGELDEHVGALNRHLLDLEKGPGGGDQADRLKEVFRAAHCLKGAARSVGVGPIEEACHLLEEILSAARAGTAPLAPERFPLLFAAADAIEEAGMRLREQQELSDSPLTALLPRLEAAARDIVTSPSPAPAARPAVQTMASPTPTPPPDGGPWAISPGAGRSPAGPPPPNGEAAARGGDPAGAADLRDPPPRAPMRPAPPPASERPAGGVAFVWVPAEKLDALLAHSGELLVTRRRVEARSEDLATLREFVGRWRAEWRVVEKPLRSLTGGHAGSGPAVRGADPPLSRRAAEAFRHAGDHLGRLDRDLDRLATALAAGQTIGDKGLRP